MKTSKYETRTVCGLILCDRHATETTTRYDDQDVLAILSWWHSAVKLVELGHPAKIVSLYLLKVECMIIPTLSGLCIVAAVTEICHVLLCFIPGFDWIISSIAELGRWVTI